MKSAKRITLEYLNSAKVEFDNYIDKLNAEGYEDVATMAIESLSDHITALDPFEEESAAMGLMVDISDLEEDTVEDDYDID